MKEWVLTRAPSVRSISSNIAELSVPSAVQTSTCATTPFRHRPVNADLGMPNESEGTLLVDLVEASRDDIALGPADAPTDKAGRRPAPSIEAVASSRPREVAGAIAIECRGRCTAASRSLTMTDPAPSPLAALVSPVRPADDGPASLAIPARSLIPAPTPRLALTPFPTILSFLFNLSSAAASPTNDLEVSFHAAPLRLSDILSPRLSLPLPSADVELDRGLCAAPSGLGSSSSSCMTRRTGAETVRLDGELSPVPGRLRPSVGLDRRGEPESRVDTTVTPSGDLWGSPPSMTSTPGPSDLNDSSTLAGTGTDTVLSRGRPIRFGGPIEFAGALERVPGWPLPTDREDG